MIPTQFIKPVPQRTGRTSSFKGLLGCRCRHSVKSIQFEKLEGRRGTRRLTLLTICVLVASSHQKLACGTRTSQRDNSVGAAIFQVVFPSKSENVRCAQSGHPRQRNIWYNRSFTRQLDRLLHKKTAHLLRVSTRWLKWANFYLCNVRVHDDRERESW